MSPVSPLRRRAEQFDAAVEGAPTGTLSLQTRELLEVVANLRVTSRPTARPDFVAALRSQLMVAAETELVTVPQRPAKVVKTRRERRVAVALGGFALVGATASMAVAAQSALPGDTLYPLKRAIENADTGLSAQSSRGPTLLSQATDRLTELDELSRQSSQPDSVATSTVQTTLGTFSDQASEAADLMLASYARTGKQTSVDQLRTFAGDSLATLGRLEADLPTSARASVLTAAQTLFRIDDAAAEACPECGAAGITTVPGGLVATSFPLQSLDPGAVLGSAGRPTKIDGSQPAIDPTTPTATLGATPTAPVPPLVPTGAITLPVANDPLVPPVVAGATAAAVGGPTQGSGTKGLLGGLGTLLGQTNASTPAPSTPSVTPPPVLPGLGGLLQGTVDTVKGITDPLLP